MLADFLREQISSSNAVISLYEYSSIYIYVSQLLDVSFLWTFSIALQQSPNHWTSSINRAQHIRFVTPLPPAIFHLMTKTKPVFETLWF
jgi:hypothetical protein